MLIIYSTNYDSYFKISSIKTDIISEQTEIDRNTIRLIVPDRSPMGAMRYGALIMIKLKLFF